MNYSVSIIIPALNEASRISQAVITAKRTAATEVIVVDGGSRDDTVTMAVDAGAEVVVSRPGRAHQQNAGAERARADVLLFQHADCQLPADAVEQINEAFESPKVGYGAFRQQIDQPGWMYRWLDHGNAARVRLLGLAYGDQGIFVKRELFQTVGGFPSEPLMEDVVLMRRLHAKGRPALLTGPIRVSARRWQTRGIVRQTARNWCLLLAFYAGVSPTRLARYYPRHDSP